MKKQILFLLLVLLVLSCTKKVTEYIEVPKDGWQIDKRLSMSNQNVLNAIISEDTLLFQTEYYPGYMSLTSQQCSFGMYMYYPISDAKPHLNKTYYFGVSQGNYGVYGNSKYLLNQGSYFEFNGHFEGRLTPTMLDSTFNNNTKILTSGYQTETIMSNGDKQFLFFFNCSTPQPDDPKNGTYYCLVDFSILDNLQNNLLDHCFKVDRVVMNKISSNYLNVKSLFFYNNTYYCSLDQNYTISTAGDIQTGTLSGDCYGYFEYQDKLWAKCNGKLKYTTDGQSWTETDHTTFNNMHFFDFEGKLCGYIGSQLYEYDLESGLWYYLDLSGMDGHIITSVNMTDSKVYISTIGGIFSRTKSEFFKNKTLTPPGK